MPCNALTAREKLVNAEPQLRSNPGYVTGAIGRSRANADPTVPPLFAHPPKLPSPWTQFFSEIERLSARLDKAERE